MTQVVDASVGLRWFVDAPGSREAAALLVSDDLLIAPDLVVPEIVNAAWKLARAGEIETTHGQRIAEAVGSAFNRLVPSTRLASRAYTLAAELDHPVYDCLYLALAELEAASLVTADRQLMRRVRGTDLEARVRALEAATEDQ